MEDFVDPFDFETSDQLLPKDEQVGVLLKEILNFKNSVADPGCLSRIRIFSHPGSKKHGEVKQIFYIGFLTFL
jgi:hypothetical protein